MYKVKFKYQGMLFSSWHVLPCLLKTKDEAEKAVQTIYDQKNVKIIDVKIEKLYSQE